MKNMKSMKSMKLDESEILADSMIDILNAAAFYLTQKKANHFYLVGRDLKVENIQCGSWEISIRKIPN